jgi:hypothetical protein
VHFRAVLKKHCLLAGDIFIIGDYDEGWVRAEVAKLFLQRVM